MDKGTEALTELSELTMPRDGIREVAHTWSGDGSLLAALAGAPAQHDDMAWTTQDVRRRARRVLLEMIQPELLALPATAKQWSMYLPVALTSRPIANTFPIDAINWPSTVRRYGWPPKRYIGRLRSRSFDEVPISTLLWASLRLSDYLADVSKTSPRLAGNIRQRIDTLSDVTFDLVPVAEPRPPDRNDILALVRSGFPWRNLAAIADLLRRSETDLEFLAFELLKADQELMPRLFHISVLGSLVAALRHTGCRVTWNYPLGMYGHGPQIDILSPTNSQWDLWFEAGKSRIHYGLPPSLYHSAVAGIEGAGSSLRADILLVDHPNRALILECKWSNNPSYVARDGYHQASSYALDAMHELANEVWSLVIGPQEVIHSLSIASEAWHTMQIVLGSTSVECLPNVVHAFLQSDPSAI